MNQNKIVYETGEAEVTIKNGKEYQSAIDEQTDLMMFVPETPEARRCDELDDEINEYLKKMRPDLYLVSESK